jgi:hypothetical protein
MQRYQGRESVVIHSSSPIVKEYGLRAAVAFCRPQCTTTHLYNFSRARIPVSNTSFYNPLASGPQANGVSIELDQVNVTTSLGVGLIGQQGLGGVGAIGKTLVLGLELRKEHELAMKKHYLKARDRFADIVHSVLAEHLLSHFWRRLDNISTRYALDEMPCDNLTAA